jgi:EAL domain-containing protein (putative c-di-GMP-specific phosphodiesterase class I)
MQAFQDQRNALNYELRQACARGELQLYYQPQLKLGDAPHRVIGAEALLRWNHPQRGLLFPEVFMQLAEETGLILDMGHWVVEAACAQLKAWEGRELTRELRLAINISARQFRQTNFAEVVHRTIEQSGIDPGRLTLELSENLLLDALPATRDVMLSLKALGVRFALDNFGSSYTSLSHLVQLPIDQLKIDHEFIRNLPEDHDSALIVQTIITIGTNFGLELIAEGVEKARQLDFLAGHGCHAYQGGLSSWPLPLQTFEQLLHH